MPNDAGTKQWQSIQARRVDYLLPLFYISYHDQICLPREHTHPSESEKLRFRHLRLHLRSPHPRHQHRRCIAAYSRQTARLQNAPRRRSRRQRRSYRKSSRSSICASTSPSCAVVRFASSHTPKAPRRTRIYTVHIAPGYRGVWIGGKTRLEKRARRGWRRLQRISHSKAEKRERSYAYELQ